MTKTNKGRCGFAFRDPQHWNNLDNDLKDIKKFCGFKRGISKKLSGKYNNHPT